MTPAMAIAMLDRQIAKHGQTIDFKRGATTQAATGFVRGYETEQLVGMLTQKDRKVVVSPSSLGAFQPRENDDFNTGGKIGKVTAAEAIQIGTTIVRWNLRVTLA
jgi:hypothetical protein